MNDWIDPLEAHCLPGSDSAGLSLSTSSIFDQISLLGIAVTDFVVVEK
jgi:hypothetical protein